MIIDQDTLKRGWIEQELYTALHNTRNEPVLCITDIARVIIAVMDGAEVAALIDELEKGVLI